MLLTLDNELADLVTALKWQDWTEMHTFAVVLTDERTVLCARVVEEEEDANLLARLEGVRADYWSIGDLFAEMLTGVAYGFSMTRATGSHRYVIAMLEAIRQHELDAAPSAA